MSSLTRSNSLIVDVLDMGDVSKSRMESVLYQLKSRVIDDVDEGVTRPDVIVLFDANRYVFHHLHKKDWSKYYFPSVSSVYYPYIDNEKSSLYTIVLTRWPFVQMQSFPNNIADVPTTHIVDLKIPLGDIPVRSSYEDTFELNIDSITLVVSKLSNKVYDSQILYEHMLKLNKISEVNPNVFYFYGSDATQINSELKELKSSIIEDEDQHKDQHEHQHEPADKLIVVENMMYVSEGWKLEHEEKENLRGIKRYFFSLTI